MTKLAVGAVPVVVLVLSAFTFAAAQTPDVQVVQLQCDGDPELVVVENKGDAAQALAGWQLRSDPPDSEVYDLSVLGALQPGASVFIQSGPSASGVFKWGLEFIFRDDDPTDYVRLVDDAGVTVQQTNCAAASEPSPTPTPEASPADGVPNGGGPPPPPGGTLSYAIFALVGGSMLAAGVVTVALSRLRFRRSRPAAIPASPGHPAGRPHVQRRLDSPPEAPLSAAFGPALVGLVVAVAVLLLWRRGE